MVVQYGPSAGRPSHDIDAEGLTLARIDVASIDWP